MHQNSPTYFKILIKKPLLNQQSRVDWTRFSKTNLHLLLLDAQEQKYYARCNEKADKLQRKKILADLKQQSRYSRLLQQFAIKKFTPKNFK